MVTFLSPFLDASAAEHWAVPFFLPRKMLVVSNKEMAKAMVVFNMSLSPHVESIQP